MAQVVTGFGYRVPLIVILVLLALVLGLALAVEFYFTISRSVYKSVRKTRRERVHEPLQSAMVEHLFDTDPAWESWVGGLSHVEREVAESLLDKYLRELDGSHADRLRELGDALDIPLRCRRELERGDEYDRLDALTWLTLLERPEPYHEASFLPQTARERAGVARLRYESDDFASPRQGIELLLHGTHQQFTVFGQDTLYRLANEDPDALMEIATAEYESWPRQLLVQVLTICEHLEASFRATELDWLASALEHEAEAVRAAAARALSSFGWQQELRDRSFLERAAADPSPRVRKAVYEMLGAWGDKQALSILMYALVTEEDSKALVHGTNALVRRRDRLDEDVPVVFGDAWAWSREHANYTRLARSGRRIPGEG